MKSLFCFLSVEGIVRELDIIVKETNYFGNIPLWRGDLGMYTRQKGYTYNCGLPVQQQFSKLVYKQASVAGMSEWYHKGCMENFNWKRMMHNCSMSFSLNWFLPT